MDWHVARVKAGEDAVESVVRSNHVEIARRFELKSQDSLLRAHYRIRPLSGTTSLDLGAFPHFDFPPEFADAFEDERDCYFDGAETGDGCELPCWRVFFKRDREQGLILVTRSKDAMSHVQILARGLDFMPHVRINYSTNYELQTAPIPFRAGRKEAYEVRFEIGPWTRARHKAIYRAGKLGDPVDIGNPAPRGTPAPGLKGKLFYAHRFAPSSQASREFRLNRWQIVKVPWAQQGKALFASTGVRPPPLVLSPKLKGTYRLFVGVGNSHGVKLRIDGDPQTTFRMLPIAERKKARKGPFDLALSGRQHAHEIKCAVVAMDGKKLRIERWPDVHNVSMIDYVRFEKSRTGIPTRPMARASGSARNRRPTFLVAGMADAPDLAPLVDPVNPSSDAVTSVIWEHARCGFDKVFWRIDGQCSDYPSKINTMRYVSAKVHGMFYAPAKAYGRLLRKIDLLRTVVDAGRKRGVGIWGWMRFNSYAGNVVSDFFVKHPESQEVLENGTKAMKLCLAFPEVRKHKIEILVEAACYGLQGVNLGFLRHAPVIHRHPVLVRGYQEKYGKEPPLCMTDRKDQTYRLSLPPMDDEAVRWYRYRAVFLTQFGRELRQRFREANLGHVKISLWLRPNHHLYDGIDLDDWLAEGLCDEVVASQRTYVDEILPLAEPSPAWKAKVQSKATLLRGVWAHDLEFAKRNLSRWIDEGYDGISTYESNASVIDSRYIEFYQGLRGG